METRNTNTVDRRLLLGLGATLPAWLAGCYRPGGKDAGSWMPPKGGVMLVSKEGGSRPAVLTVEDGTCKGKGTFAAVYIPGKKGFYFNFAGDVSISRRGKNKTLSKGQRLYFTVDNLLGTSYVAARRPFGARPGKPFAFMVGYKIALGD